jgi:hypothetical protein
MNGRREPAGERGDFVGKISYGYDEGERDGYVVFA